MPMYKSTIWAQLLYVSIRSIDLYNCTRNLGMCDIFIEKKVYEHGLKSREREREPFFSAL